MCQLQASNLQAFNLSKFSTFEAFEISNSMSLEPSVFSEFESFQASNLQPLKVSNFQSFKLPGFQTFFTPPSQTFKTRARELLHEPPPSSTCPSRSTRRSGLQAVELDSGFKPSNSKLALTFKLEAFKLQAFHSPNFSIFQTLQPRPTFDT